MRRLANQVALALVAVLGLTSFAAAGATSKLPPTADCATVATGSHGPAVVTLQRAVKATPDGDFGPLTAKAVATWRWGFFCVCKSPIPDNVYLSAYPCCMPAK